MDWFGNQMVQGIGLHGWLALILVAIGVAGLSIGLMVLARRPHDASYKRPTDPTQWNEHGDRRDR